MHKEIWSMELKKEKNYFLLKEYRFSLKSKTQVLFTHRFFTSVTQTLDNKKSTLIYFKEKGRLNSHPLMLTPKHTIGQNGQCTTKVIIYFLSTKQLQYFRSKYFYISGRIVCS